SAGAMSAGDGHLLLESDANGLIALLSPPDLPARARDARTFVLGLSNASAVRRVDLFSRGERDREWRRIASATGATCRETAAGLAFSADVRNAEAYQWRVELAFETPTSCTLTRFAALLE